ncbi:MAG: glycosyltransferase, partial [Gemmatimonadales bacterium]
MAYDVLCFSHLRWASVYQRPQHLMTRCATTRRVYFLEEPIIGPRIELEVRRAGGLRVVTPHLPSALSRGETNRLHRRLLDRLMAAERIDAFVAWYYTPMALGASRHLTPMATVYDCMDELSAFAGAPPELVERERELFRRADVVFTGGYSLYEAKRESHPRVYAFPSSVDVEHFARARSLQRDPPDQARIARPRLGFFGVLDERLDRHLLAGLAALRPHWQFVLVGPTAKIDPATLPAAANIHYLGSRPYRQLPAYLAGWDVALLLFARNEATRFISPTKTPEYLAGGRPVVSTPIRDVVSTYGDRGLVRIAADPASFAAACEAAMQEPAARRLAQVDAFLRHGSWDATWAAMAAII